MKAASSLKVYLRPACNRLATLEQLTTAAGFPPVIAPAKIPALHLQPGLPESTRAANPDLTVAHLSCLKRSQESAHSPQLRNRRR